MKLYVDCPAWCPPNGECVYFDLQENAVYGDGKVVVNQRRCENENVCINAVNAYKKYEKEQNEWKSE